MRKYLALPLLLTLIPALASADSYDRKCTVTPSIKKVEHYPGRAGIITSNNLALPEGKSVYAEGQRVYISGHVLDKNCVPISDAIVEIWQANPDGQYIPLSRSDLLSPYPYFAGSGRAVTDNLGRFSFVTLFPGSESPTHAPHINFHVVLDGFPALNTEMFFAEDRRNKDDKVLSELPFADQDLLLAKVSPLDDSKVKDGLAIKWDIVLNGVNAFRKY